MATIQPHIHMGCTPMSTKQTVLTGRPTSIAPEALHARLQQMAPLAVPAALLSKHVPSQRSPVDRSPSTLTAGTRRRLRANHSSSRVVCMAITEKELAKANGMSSTRRWLPCASRRPADNSQLSRGMAVDTDAAFATMLWQKLQLTWRVRR